MDTVSERRAIAEREHRFAAPGWVVFDALVDPGQRARWLEQAPGEVGPAIVGINDQSNLVWSSLWPVSPDDTIEFDLEPDGRGTKLTYRWMTEQPPDERGVGITRHRLNRYFGSHLRGWVDGRDSPVSWDRTDRR
jgi:hypothetical protein